MRLYINLCCSELVCAAYPEDKRDRTLISVILRFNSFDHKTVGRCFNFKIWSASILDDIQVASELRNALCLFGIRVSCG